MTDQERLSRRRFVGVVGGALAGLAGVALAGCETGTRATATSGAGVPAAASTAVSTSKTAGGSTAASGSPAAAASPAGGAVAGGKVTLRWWDHFQPLIPLHKQIFADYSASHPNVTVEYTGYNPNDMGQALQLAFKSNQMPDVHSVAGLNVPIARLVAENWFSPVDLGAARDRLPAGSLIEGFTVFNGKTYSFPTFSFRQYTTLTWYNTDLIAGAGVDPHQGVWTWDNFRKAAAAITKKGNGQIFGWIQGIGFAQRLGVHLDDLAQTAGAPGGVDPKTGAYTYATDPYFQALEFLLSLQKDGSLFPASSTLDARTGRARWASGVGGCFFDGPWNIGVVVGSLKEFTGKVGVAPVPVANAAQPPRLYSGPTGGQFYISSQSKHADIASQILQLLTTPDYYVGLAKQMDQPPLDLSAVDKADVQPTYKQAINYFKDAVLLAPTAVVKNPAVADVQAEMKDIHPNLGEIAQGAFSGDVKDYRAALKTYSDQLTAERDRAIKVVQGKGTKVSVDDWIFKNWDPAKDYTPDLYKS